MKCISEQFKDSQTTVGYKNRKMVQTRSGKRTYRIEWTDKMLIDLLYCKNKALSVTTSKNPPMKNGRKIGYISYMHQLWISLGYERFGKTPRNLSSVAHRAEQNLSKSVLSFHNHLLLQSIMLYVIVVTVRTLETNKSIIELYSIDF